MTTSKKKVPIDFELGEGCDNGWLRDYKQKKMFIWILSLRLDLDYTTTSRKKKCLLILRGAVRVDYVTTGQKKKCLLILKGWMGFDYMTTSEKKKCLLILNLVKAVVMVDYVTTSKKKMFIWILSLQLEPWLHDYRQKKSVTRIWEMLLGLTTWLQAKKKVPIDFERVDELWLHDYKR